MGRRSGSEQAWEVLRGQPLTGRLFSGSRSDPQPAGSENLFYVQPETDPCPGCKHILIR